MLCWNKLVINPILLLCLILAACGHASDDGTVPFPEGKYCYFSGNEAILINNGILSSLRKNIKGVKVRIKVGAKTGDKFVFPQEDISLSFDNKGEYLEKRKSNISFWPFSNNKDVRSNIHIYFKSYDGHNGEVVFYPNDC